MDAQKILKFCLEKGFLVDKEVLNLFSETSDLESLGLIVEKIKGSPINQVWEAKQTFCENQDKVNEVFLSLPEKKQESLEKLKIKLGLSIEISHEKRVAFEENVPEEDVCQVNPFSGVKILSNPIQPNKKIEVKDFVLHFKNRFSELSNILQQHSELSSLYYNDCKDFGLSP